MELNKEQVSRIVSDVLRKVNVRSSDSTESASARIPVGAKSGRAAVLKSAGELAIVEFPLREIGPDEILVKVEACGVCPIHLAWHPWCSVTKAPAK